MAQGDQVRNGKAFEYAIATQYAIYLQNNGIRVNLDEESIEAPRQFYLDKSPEERCRFDRAAQQTIATIIKLEPGLVFTTHGNDILQIKINPDAKGETGDVRDIVFKRTMPLWEVGFSAKNNNDAVKHSRIAKSLDFGQSWVGVPCSDSYWEEIQPIFNDLERRKRRRETWESMGEDKHYNYYVPILSAFRKELLRIYDDNDNIPRVLIQYLLGRYPFYKIIKDDKNNIVIVKAFNIDSGLHQPRNGHKSHYSTPSINYPTRIVEFEFKNGTTDTLQMILDGGWEISFRIHNASKLVEPSLKFDIRLLGNPPILFTQHLFQD